MSKAKLPRKGRLVLDAYEKALEKDIEDFVQVNDFKKTKKETMLAAKNHLKMLAGKKRK